jgi:hypothetical protein
MRVKEFLLVFALEVMSMSGACGQSKFTPGTIRGNVPDGKACSLPGAGVEAKNLVTNDATTTVTSEEGHFVFLSLAPGRYALTVSKQGFAPGNCGFLTVGQTITLPIKMKVSDSGAENCRDRCAHGGDNDDRVTIDAR